MTARDEPFISRERKVEFSEVWFTVMAIEFTFFKAIWVIGFWVSGLGSFSDGCDSISQTPSLIWGGGGADLGLFWGVEGLETFIFPKVRGNRPEFISAWSRLRGIALDFLSLPHPPSETLLKVSWDTGDAVDERTPGLFYCRAWECLCVGDTKAGAVSRRSRLWREGEGQEMLFQPSCPKPGKPGWGPGGFRSRASERGHGGSGVWGWKPSRSGKTPRSWHRPGK